MNCAFGQAIITPPIGIWLTGFAARTHGSDGVLDDLYAQCAVFEEEGRWAVLARADILSFHPDSVARIREGIEARAKIPADCVMLTSSHTHSGPAVADIKGLGQTDETYMRNMENIIVGMVVSTAHSLTPVALGIGKSALPEVGFVREGEGVKSLNRDPDVLLLKIASADGEQTLGVLVNYTCHPVLLSGDNYLISADYPGRVRAFIERNLGAKALFLQGACGDINPFWRKASGGLAPRVSSVSDIDRVGRILGAEAVKLSEMTACEPQTGLASVSTTVALPTLRPDRAALEKMVEESRAAISSNPKERTDPYTQSYHPRRVEWATKLLGLLDSGAFPEAIRCPVHILKIGKALIVGVGAEVFSEIGVTVKQRLGAERTFFVGYTNGCIGYIPSSASYESAGYGARESAMWYDMPMQAKGSDGAAVEGVKRIVEAVDV